MEADLRNVVQAGVTEESEEELHDAESGNFEGDDVVCLETSIEDELRCADEHATKTALLIEDMKKSISSYQSMENLSPEDERSLQLQQEELFEKLNDFEKVTRRVQNLVGISLRFNFEDTTSLTDPRDKDKFRLHCDDDCQPFDPNAKLTTNVKKMALKTVRPNLKAVCDHEDGRELKPSNTNGYQPSNTNFNNEVNGEECTPGYANNRGAEEGEDEDAQTEKSDINRMECELQDMQQELAQVQKEREVLECQRKVLKNFATDIPCIPGKALRDGWRSDQMVRLQEDLECKILENQTLHAQVERLKAAIEATQRGMDDWEARACELEQKLRCLEQHKNKMADTKVRQMELEQQNQLAVNKCRELQEECDELRALIDEQAGHLECYRNKYLLAQQQVEEQKRQIEQMEAETGRIGPQVQCEIQRMKAQFQEQLAELSPLPDLLKCAQAKLQEAQQLRLIAENNCGDLARELENCREEVRLKLLNREYESQICKLRLANQQFMDERTTLRSYLEAYETKCNKLKEDVNKYKQTICQLEEAASCTEKSLEERQLECARLRVLLDSVRDDATRQATKARERYDTMRRTLQCQVSDLEQQLACSRAAATAALRERDEIQEKLQVQVADLAQSVDQTQDRIKDLQNVVVVVRSNVLSSETRNSQQPQQLEPPRQQNNYQSNYQQQQQPDDC